MEIDLRSSTCQAAATRRALSASLRSIGIVLTRSLDRSWDASKRAAETVPDSLTRRLHSEWYCISRTRAKVLADFKRKNTLNLLPGILIL